MSHIQRAINDIEKFTFKVNKNVFLKDKILSSAVLFQFSIIGEAVIYINSDFLD